MSSTVTSRSGVGAQINGSLLELLNCDDIVPGSDPSYQTCKTIYAYHPIGAKLVDNPILMAQSQEREIAIPNSPEEKCREAFLREWKAVNADAYIAQTYGLARIYGIGSVALVQDGDDAGQPLRLDKLADAKIGFNCFDPLNTAGSLVLNQDPNSVDFQKVLQIQVQGRAYHRSRVVVVQNERPLYIEWTNASFGYVGRSVYQRALFPLKSFINSMITDDMVVVKSGVLIAKMKAVGSIVDGIMQTMFGAKRALLKEAKTYNVLTIDTEEAIETLNMQNIDGAYGMARKNILENIAASDNMPAKLLNQETFAEGFGEGTEDAKYIAQFVDRIRLNMGPLYDFFDRIVQHRAWNKDFYRTIQNLFPEDYGEMPYDTAFTQWQNSFAATWPSLLREPDSEKIKVDDVKLKAIIAIVEVFLPGMDPANKAIMYQWAQDNINEMKLLFSSVFELDIKAFADFAEEQQAKQEEISQGGEEDEDGPKKPTEPKPFAATDSERSHWTQRRHDSSAVAALAQRIDDVDEKVAHIARRAKVHVK